MFYADATRAHIASLTTPQQAATEAETLAEKTTSIFNEFERLENENNRLGLSSHPDDGVFKALMSRMIESVIELTVVNSLTEALEARLNGMSLKCGLF